MVQAEEIAEKLFEAIKEDPIDWFQVGYLTGLAKMAKLDLSPYDPTLEVSGDLLSPQRWMDCTIDACVQIRKWSHDAFELPYRVVSCVEMAESHNEITCVLEHRMYAHAFWFGFKRELDHMLDNDTSYTEDEINRMCAYEVALLAHTREYDQVLQVPEIRSVWETIGAETHYLTNWLVTLGHMSDDEMPWWIKLV